MAWWRVSGGSDGGSKTVNRVVTTHQGQRRRGTLIQEEGGEWMIRLDKDAAGVTTIVRRKPADVQVLENPFYVKVQA